MDVGVAFSIFSGLLDRLNNWRWRRYPPVVITLSLDGRTASARVAAFDHPIFIKAITFDLLGKKEVVVALNQMLAPHGQLDCPIPKEVLRQLVLTNDLAISARYRTQTNKLAQTDSPIFNLVGGDGQVIGVTESGKYLGWGQCPKCGEEWMFSTAGVANVKELNRRRRAYERDLKRTCPDHDESRKKFWV
jgi:hypothetical protein